MAYRSIIIENFRGISKLEMLDFGQVNLLVGRNNCGKTTVLDAFFLLSGMSNPQLSVNINAFRNLVITDDEEFAYLFKNIDLSQPIKLSGMVNSKNRELMIKPIFRKDVPTTKESLSQREIQKSTLDLSTSTSSTNTIEGLASEYRINKGKQHLSVIKLKGHSITIPSNYREEIACTYLNTNSIMLQIDKRIEKLLIQKKLDSIIDVLRIVEPRVIDIRIGTQGNIFIDIGLDQLVPLNLSGDGMRRLLSILVSAANNINGLLLIDEIENGFHYSSLSTLWKALIAASKEYNVQIIATTHSNECIEALSSATEIPEGSGNGIKLFRISRNNDGTHSSHLLDNEMIELGLENNYELR